MCGHLFSRGQEGHSISRRYFRPFWSFHAILQKCLTPFLSMACSVSVANIANIALQPCELCGSIDAQPDSSLPARSQSAVTIPSPAYSTQVARVACWLGDWRDVSAASTSADDVHRRLAAFHYKKRTGNSGKHHLCRKPHVSFDSINVRRLHGGTEHCPMAAQHWSENVSMYPDRYSARACSSNLTHFIRHFIQLEESPVLWQITILSLTHISEGTRTRTHA